MPKSDNPFDNADGSTVYINYSPDHGYVVTSYGTGESGVSYKWFPPDVIPDNPDKDIDPFFPRSIDE